MSEDISFFFFFFLFRKEEGILKNDATSCSVIHSGSSPINYREVLPSVDGLTVSILGRSCRTIRSKFSVVFSETP